MTCYQIGNEVIREELGELPVLIQRNAIVG